MESSQFRRTKIVATVGPASADREIVDEGCGPANLNVIEVEGKTIIHSSNHTMNEAALYVVSE